MGLEAGLSESEAEYQLRLDQPIYLFVQPPPPDMVYGHNSALGYTTSSLHHWSFEETGIPPLPPDVCHNLGLPIEFNAYLRSDLDSWHTDSYRLLRQYQLLQGFDPTTTNFARRVGFDDHVFASIDNSYRFEVVDEARPAGHNYSPETYDPEQSSTTQQHENPAPSNLSPADILTHTNIANTMTSASSSHPRATRTPGTPPYERTPISRDLHLQWDTSAMGADFNGDLYTSALGGKDSAFTDPAIYAINTTMYHGDAVGLADIPQLTTTDLVVYLPPLT
ncbi:hypothetical protein AAF712_015010 [Marasmius tenuissimus]|uniref:Uncharacterized protein n=1 Tax=Marasmius tenuissimus TaxID=585030 RepID=A0ABR2ZAS6_9AGAR